MVSKKEGREGLGPPSLWVLALGVVWGLVWGKAYAVEAWERVLGLGLEYHGLRLGQKLGRAELRGFEPMAEAYEGVIRYRSSENKNLIIALSEEDARLLAFYESWKGVESSELKWLKHNLKVIFGDPTVEAHGNSWWLYGPKGKIEREEYDRLKKAGVEPEVWAIVKWISVPQKEFYYLTIFSPILIRQYISEDLEREVGYAGH